MCKLGIMQPYFFPYIGYWQLMAMVDRYVVYDDVNYIKGGWVNRNRILVQGTPHYVNLLLSKASPNKKINEMELLEDNVARKKLLRTIRESYAKAPCFGKVYPLVERILLYDESNLARYLFHHHQVIAGYLGIGTELVLSSRLDKDNTLKGETKILAICETLGADTYVNAIGGQSLYTKEHFSVRGMELYFLRTGEIGYRQFNNDFVPNLSIIDVMMFNPVERVREMLGEYILL